LKNGKILRRRNKEIGSWGMSLNNNCPNNKKLKKGWALPESLQAASQQAFKLDRGPGIL
jgi:hypothetical protein